MKTAKDLFEKLGYEREEYKKLNNLGDDDCE